MTLWFLRGLRRGVVTTHYPHRPESSAALLPTPPSFRSDALTPQVADLLCAVCPSHALRRDGEALLFDVGACTACGRCQEVAPAAVRASGEFELATADRAALIKRIPLLGRDS
jgi:formate hydrogenlyase subunit 6/NADH:ubiquinone oxidoreductase subunit I